MIIGLRTELIVQTMMIIGLRTELIIQIMKIIRPRSKRLDHSFRTCDVMGSLWGPCSRI